MTSTVPGPILSPDYHHQVCQLGGTNDDNLIIRNLPLFLFDAARA
jgi:hypothetical protein